MMTGPSSYHNRIRTTTHKGLLEPSRTDHLHGTNQHTDICTVTITGWMKQPYRSEYCNNYNYSRINYNYNKASSEIRERMAFGFEETMMTNPLCSPDITKRLRTKHPMMNVSPFFAPCWMLL